VRTLLFAGLLALFSVPSAVFGQEEAAAPEQTEPVSPKREEQKLDGPVWADVELIKDRVAGSFSPPPRSSREVSSVRSGTETPSRAGERLVSGEALRTGAGIALLRLDDGSAIHVAEGSQLRVARPIVQRIGTLLYVTSGRLDVQAGGRTFHLDRATVRLTSNSQGTGHIEVLAGTAQIGDLDVVAAGKQAHFKQGSPPEVTELKLGTQEALTIWRAERFLPGELAPTKATRAQVRLGGGMASLLSANWASIRLDARLRLRGEAWLNIGGAITLRPGEVDESEPVYWSVPIHLGARWIRDLPGHPLYFGLGGDAQLLLFPGCPSADSCGVGVTPRPGALASALAGVRLHPKLTMDIELSGGFHAFALPDAGGAAPLLMPQVGITAALVLRP